MRKLRIFISSPGDVAEERALTERILERLQGEFSHRGALEPIFWEHEPLLASAGFQEQIAEPGETDVVLTILWARLGTRLPANVTRADGSRYASGTEYEFENALAAFRAKGSPHLLVYRKMAELQVSLSDEKELLDRLQQKRALDEFIRQNFFSEAGTSITLAFHPYRHLAEFEELAERHLRRLLDDLLPATGDEREGDARSLRWRGSPFRGLEVFDFEHAPIFFGRSRAVSEVLDALRAQAAEERAFVLVLGMSGGGKSSLVRAGVLPLLTRPGVIEGIGVWRRASMRPGDGAGDLLQALATALLRDGALPEVADGGTGASELAKILRDSPKGAPPLVKAGLRQVSAALAGARRLDRRPEARLALVVDQLEEIFTLESVTDADRRSFVAALDALARCGHVWVLATLRSDFFPRCAELEVLAALKQGAGQYDLQPPTPAEIGQMIRHPTYAAGLRFAEDPETHESLDETLLGAASGNPAALPLLEFVLEELYGRCGEKGVLTPAAYRDLGGLEGCLAHRAEEVLGRLEPPVREALPRVLRHLVRLATGAEEAVSRQRAPLDAWTAGSPERALIDAFVDARLFVTELDDEGRATVSVAHEALLRHWPRLAGWLDENRESLRVRARVANAAAQWLQEERRADFLLPPGKALIEAAELLDRHRGDLDADEAAFVAASIARGRRQARRKRGLVGALIVLLVAAAGASYRVDQDRRRAAEEARLARSCDLARQSLSVLATSRFDVSLLVSLEALRVADTFEARSSLLAGLETSPRLATLIAGHERQVWRVVWADGETLITAGQDGTVRSWNVAGGEERSVLQAGEPLFSLARGPDGGLVAAGRRIHLWDAGGEALGEPLAADGEILCDLALSPDGRLLAAAGYGGTVRLWEPGTLRPHGEPLALEGPSGVFDLAWSPDGRTLAVSGNAENVTLWEPESGLRRELPGQANRVWCVAWSPDGRTLAAAGGEDLVQLLDVANGEVRGVLRGHTDSVRTVAWSPDGRTLASGGEDETVRLWDPATLEAVGRFTTGRLNVVNHLAWSPDGRSLAAAGVAGLVQVWRIAADAGRLVGHTDRVLSLAWSADGRLLASASEDRTLRLWETASGRSAGRFEYPRAVTAVAVHPGGELLALGAAAKIHLLSLPLARELSEPVLSGGKSLVSSLAFSPDGKLLAAAQGVTVHVWDTASWEPAAKLKGHEDVIRSLAWSPDGRVLASGGFDRTVRRWDVGAAAGEPTGEPLGEPLAGHLGPVWSLAWSPDGRTLASGGEVLGVLLRDGATGERLGEPLSGHTGRVWGLAWSPDSRMLASAGDDGKVLLWKADGRRLVAELHSHQAAVRAVAWGPDGRLASSSDDQTVFLRDLSGDLEAWKERACRRAGRDLTAGEWREFFGETGYRESCPGGHPGGP